jgi:hypothetical protein
VRDAIRQTRGPRRSLPRAPKRIRWTTAVLAEQRSAGRVKATPLMKEKDPRRDDGAALKFFATCAPPLNYFAKLRILSEWKRPPFGALSAARL